MQTIFSLQVFYDVNWTSTLEWPGAERSVFIGIHGHSSDKKNRRGSKLGRNVKNQYLGKLKFIQRQKKFLDRTAAIFKSKRPNLGRSVFLVLNLFFVNTEKELLGLLEIQVLEIHLYFKYQKSTHAFQGLPNSSFIYHIPSLLM